MFISRFLILTLIAAAFALPAAAQTALSGNVVEVLDGRTFVLETASGRITGSIQFVDVPEAEQPLSRIVREHLERLILGKPLVFVPGGFSPTTIVGRAYLGGLDLGQQLVRDGAAWHIPAERTGQPPEEETIYSRHEALARLEKRGVWSITNLTPAWEFRSKAKVLTGASFTNVRSSDADKKERRNYLEAKTDPDMWVDVGGDAFARINGNGSLFWGFDPEKKIRNTATEEIAQTISSTGHQLEVVFRFIHLQGEIRPRVPNTAFVVGVLATSRNHTFGKDNRLVFVADGKEVLVGSGQRFWRETGSCVEELIQYRIGKSDLIQIANAKKLTVEAGAYSGNVDEPMKAAIKRLLLAIG